MDWFRSQFDRSALGTAGKMPALQSGGNANHCAIRDFAVRDLTTDWFS